MSLLTQQDRNYILEQLKLAPDNVLAEAMLKFNEMRDQVVQVRKLTAASEATVDTFSKDITAYEAELVIKNALRKNVSPGKSSIGKIGSSTKDVIFELLRSDKKPAAKYDEHLKLLWERGEVKFDGEEYYL